MFSLTLTYSCTPCGNIARGLSRQEPLPSIMAAPCIYMHPTLIHPEEKGPILCSHLSHIVVCAPTDDNWLCNWMFVYQREQQYVGYAPSYDGWLC